MRLVGKCSWFGGPNDTGVAPDEGLAFIFSVDDQPSLFLDEQPPGTSGLARRLDPEQFYVACRWDYDAPDTSKSELLGHKASVRSLRTGRRYLALPGDWGPNSNTGRIADLSPGLMTALGITTDDEVEVIYPFGEEEQDMAIHKVCISAGHGLHCPGAEGLEFDEEDETPRVMHGVAEELRRRGVTVTEFWDKVSDNVSDNLDAIVNFHNSQAAHDLDISCHFNASNGDGHGCEVLYKTQEELAAKVSAAIAGNGFTDRGAKYRDDLKFLNATSAPALLIETCFLDHIGDVETYQARFDGICASIATAISGAATGRPPRPERPERPPPGRPEAPPVVTVSMTVPHGVDIRVMVNGEELMQD
jgi:N-acetylmuramoyl-L-alanine amidase